jgi:hypothetical protein
VLGEALRRANGAAAAKGPTAAGAHLKVYEPSVAQIWRRYKEKFTKAGGSLPEEEDGSLGFEPATED